MSNKRIVKIVMDNVKQLISDQLPALIEDAIDEIAGGGGGGAAPSNSPFVTWGLAGTAPGLTNNRRLADGVGTTINNGAGADDPIAVDLTATGVVAGDYKRVDVTLDAQGRVTAATDGVVTETYSRQMFVPPALPGAPPFIVQEFDIITPPVYTSGPPNPGLAAS